MSEKSFLPGSLAEATGNLPYTLTNDYMFRAVLQKNNHVLKHLICALLHLQADQVSSARPTTHIGILDFTLFKDFPEFYAIHKLINVKNQHIYNDKFTLNVLDLTCIKLATEEDRLWHIDYWASFFKATTWEEIKMAAQNADIFQEAAETIYEVSADEQIRLQCEARERYYSTMAYFAHEIADRDAVIAEQSATMAEQSSQLAEEKD